MSIVFEQRNSDLQVIESITHGYTTANGSVTRPASPTWHLVISRHNGCSRVFFVGPWQGSGTCRYASDAEILWIQFRIGVYLPLLPPSQIVNQERVMPEGTGRTLLLNGVRYQLPDFENAELFVQRLVRENDLTFDPIVDAVMHDRRVEAAPRTVRHRFLTVTGQSHKHIRQFQRAQQAADWLRNGRSILDVTYELGYSDQPHLTRSLRRFIGSTPAQLSRSD